METIAPIPHRNMAKTPKIPVYLLILLLAVTSCRLPPRAAAQAPAAGAGEAPLLLQIKRAWGDPPVLAAWNGSAAAAHCYWQYVTCDGAGRVTNLSLANTNVTGPVPDAVGELTSLVHLDLSNNNINGSFPTSVYRCASLLYLNLSKNYFEGELPADIGLRLGENLTTLGLNGNTFIGTIPKSLSKLQKLEWLTLDNNNLTGTIPAELGDLTNLRTLMVGYNKFEPAELPTSFKSLTKLTFLSVPGCKLVGNIPDYVADMPELEMLDLPFNNFAGSIPPGIWSMKKLKHLYLYSNNFTGEIVVDGAIGAVNLVQIDLSSNYKLTGPIPEGFGDLQKLELLNLFYNNFSGEITASIGRLPSLQTIKLFDNSFTGVLPPELGQKSQELFDVELDNNKFTGPIPEGLCENGKLIAFTAANNLLNGSIPERLAGCSTLDSIILSNNQLSGEVPESLWTATKLQYALLENNRFTGILPATMYSGLEYLTLENNEFSGSIPAAAAALYKFTAGNNNFSGEIPASLSNDMPLLQNLNLSGNHLSGGIPKSFAKFKSLNQLDLSRNELSGEIPAKLGDIPVLNALDLSSNNLSGEIPLTLARPSLNSLNLSSNQLGGQVPAALATAAYERSFLDNPNLCTSSLGSSSLAGVRSCDARSGSPAGASSGGVSPGLRAGLLAAGAALVLVIAGLAFFAVRDIKRRRSAAARGEDWKVTPFQPDLGFSTAAVLRGLTEENLVARGGSGSVYRVKYTNRYTGGDGAVAVKKIRASAAGKVDEKVEREFESEASILGNVRHVNIVRLLCFVSGAEAKLLVYDYMENGSLDGWLHGRRTGAINARARSARGGVAPALDWPTRLRVAVGAAQGLHYMHHECTPPIVHRDVKTSNILLDSEFRAKVADFGLARMLAQAGTPDTMSAVAGSFGYMAPECGYTRKVDEKVDVYSFGVVLLELTTGKTANDGGEYGCLADWARHHYQSGGSVTDATDQCIRYACYSDEVEVVFRLGVMCTGATPSSRPTMKDVLQILVRCSEQTHLKCKAESGQEYEAAPLLLPQQGSRRKQLSNAKGADDDSDERSDFHSIV
uniref:non-specific serine/threonine protein kinase n=1 Tax=Leersia perrieri TaxID=77586 RepID=A0A0D9V5H3_9ORYZ